MAALYEEFPDAEALVSSHIRNDLSVNVYSSIPRSPTWPLITVKRIGGTPAEKHHLDRAIIQIDIWGGASGDDGTVNKGSIHDLAQSARVSIHEMEGSSTQIGSGDDFHGYVTAVEDISGLFWLPDPTTGRDRYTFTVAVFLHG